MRVRWIFQGVVLLILGLLPQSAMTRDSMRAVIPDALLECYRNQRLVVKDNLLPMTMSVLIDLIRKVESYQGLNMDIRTLATVLLQRFRIDGIERDPEVMANDYVVPYRPSGSEFYKYRFLMDTLIPSQSYTFPNDSLTLLEQCTLHRMLSSSVDRWMRGDESSVCNNRLSNYPDWGSRIRRQAQPNHVQPGRQAQNPNEPDAEVIDPSAMQNDMARRPSNPRFQSYQTFGGGSSADYPLSACPIENGVVYSRYGPVKIGVVLAGIAAGLQPQTVSQQNLLQAMKLGSVIGMKPQTLPPRGGYPGGHGNGYPSGGGGGFQSGGGYPGGGGGYSGRNDYSVNNVWAATLSGEIAEVAILQGPAYGQSMRIGLSGSWNNTLTPRYYFLSEENKDALTETDIRGGVDGLFIGKNIMDWNRMANGGLRLSQVLELYYSDIGVFDSNNKACKRKDKFSQVAPINDLQKESESFARILQYEQPSAVNQAPEAISEFSQIAVSKLTSAVSSLVEPTCSTDNQQQPLPPRPAADLYLVIDCNWDFRNILNVLSNLIERCDVNQYGSRVTLINGKDGGVLVNTTQHLQRFYNYFNSTIYNTYSRGFDLGRSLKVVQERIEIEMNQQRQSTSRYQQNRYYDSNQDPYQSYYSRQQVNYGTSQVPLTNLPRVIVLIPSMNAGPGSGDGDSSYIRNKITYYRTNLPDVKLLYFVTGSRDRYTQYSKTPNQDIFTLAAGTDSSIASSVKPLVARIADIPRPIINPTCGSTWVGRSYSTVQITAYLLPNSIQYYRVHPNYFYKSSDARIRVQSQSSVSLTVCQSRTNPLPNGNRTLGGNSGETQCKQITSEPYELRIGEGSCGDNYAFQCNPYYISISAPQSSQNNFNCREEDCRYPNMIKLTISHEGLSCYSGVAKIIGNPIVIIILIFVSIKDYV